MSKVEELLNLMTVDASDKIEKAMVDALVYGVGGITLNVGGQDSTITFSNVQNPNYWGDSVVSITKREWEVEVNFD
jgi:hypothetical protein